MSSVHSQTSDVVVEDSKGQLRSGKTSGNGTTATRTMSNNSGKSTITFEKQKVKSRARTQSVQSVLSCISLRSMVGNNEETLGSYPHHGSSNNGHSNNNHNSNGGSNNGSSGNNGGGVGNVGVPATQQIQSPAMASVQKRASHSYYKDAIGQKLPFTDDKRRQLENDGQRFGSRASNTKLSKTNLRDHNTSTASSGSSNSAERILESDVENEAEQQKRLTTDALRRLSSMRKSATVNGNSNGNGKLLGNGTRSEPPEENNEVAHNASEQPVNSTYFEPNPVFRDSYIGETDPETLTHIQFGGKNIIMDSSIPNKRASIAPVRNALDMLPSTLGANSNATTSGTNTSKSKRPPKQLNAPKKPLYTPAVLRDISETNITNAELGSSGPPCLTSYNSGGRTSRSSVRSVRSTSSSIISDYTKKLTSLWHRDHTYASAAELIPPTRNHWIADNKRHSCHYCHRIFTFWERKHHCRHCGDIFCTQHVRHWLYLDSDAKFVIGGAGVGALSKICDGCLQEYDTLVREGPSTTGNVNQQSDTPKSVTPVPRADVSLAQKNLVEEEGKRGRLDSIVGSVPADWNWSSF
ncbi:LADA_0G04478g1_1 [Lachancea dasiensis]|uniref:LADA_0G04478g1_1 n=1 Tax=Lachancea dasiensis TaxID=1072105 RepID=A0A1G4JSG3_9SACH|nr:LADA_0G04478g1_1 [Lachancea dasiensis]